MQVHYPPHRLKRFWAKVDTSAGPDECWPWIGAKRHGRGKFWSGEKTVNAARFSWMLAHGRWSDCYVCHRCDNIVCVNPAHLFEGDHIENMRDMRLKGRARSGGSYKLSDADVQSIRALYYPGKPHHKGNVGELAQRFGVSEIHVHMIVRNRARQGVH